MLDNPETDNPLQPLPAPLPPVENPRAAWSAADLILFGSFFLLNALFLLPVLVFITRIFRPGLQVADLTAVDQVVFTGIMDLILVGFIMVLVKVVHGRSFLETIHWYRRHQFSTGFLVSLGATLAVSVLIVSSVFPPSSAPPIEKLLSSTKSLWVFAVFGIGIAPLFEEIIFRGFLFKVFFDLLGPGVAIPATAFLFMMMHIPQLWGSWAGIVLIFVVGYVLALLRERSSSLIPSLVVHTAYNGMLFGMYAVSTLVQKGIKP